MYYAEQKSHSFLLMFDEITIEKIKVFQSLLKIMTKLAIKFKFILFNAHS